MKKETIKLIDAVVGITAGAAVAGLGAAYLVAKKKRLSIHKGKDGFIYVYEIKGADGTPLRVMRQGGVYQSATYVDDRRFEAPFEYLRSFEHIFDSNTDIKNVCMIGGGGYAYPKHLLSHHSDVHIDVVEYDPAVTLAAMHRFYLYEAMKRFTAKRLQIINDDGAHYLEHCSRTYDAILNDAFVGAKADSAMGGSMGAILAYDKLNEGGIFATNFVAPLDSPAMDKALETLAQVFKHVYVVPCIDEEYAAEDNYLLIASDAEHPYPTIGQLRGEE